MDEGAVNESTPDLKDIEMKIGRKTPEGLLRCLREETSSFRGEAKLPVAHDGGKETGKKSLDEKIRKLKMEMAHLRSVDVKILQQLLAVHEGIEAVKWLMEERSTLTSRCSSLTSSQYSLGEGPDTSWRGSWSSLQDPNDKLDNISIGSYLDTLADDMDEYCASSSESVIFSAVPPVSEAVAGALTAGAPVTAAGAGVRSDSGARLRSVGNDHKIRVGNGTEVKGRPGSVVSGAVTGVTETVNGKTVVSVNKSECSKHDAPVWTKAADTIQTQSVKVNNVLEKPAAQTGSPTKVNLSKKVGSSQSPKVKPYKNGKIEMDTCKMNGKTHLEYDAHWRWVQSQEDVTFL